MHQIEAYFRTTGTGISRTFSIPMQVLTGLGYLATGNYQNKNVTGIS